MDFTFNLLKELTEANGVAGYEAPVRAVVHKYFSGLGEISQDKIGSLICKKQGTSAGPRVMLAGHMDEIGFMVKQITKEGFIKFIPLGGWFDQVMLGHRIIIQGAKGDVVGVIGAKPPHLVPADERSKMVPKKDMYIDIGATSQAEVEEAGVRLGDPIVPRADFVQLSNGNTYLAKAFDDRVGVGLVISALTELQKVEHPNSVFGVATVMEEVGLRGATTSVRVVDPDVAIVLESDIAGDVPGIKPDESSIKLGAGPTLLIYEARTIPNHKLHQLAVETAKADGIDIQISFVEAGGTDGGAIHLHGVGVPTIILSVAARHIHSHSSIIHRHDYDKAVKLLVALIRRLDAQTVASLTE
jgi:endoglucanase